MEKLLKIDRNVAIVTALDMLSAGIDTTSSTIKSLLYLLAQHPDKQEKLRQEIFRILPNKVDLLTSEKLKNLPYLRACMKEQQRILPVASANVRVAANDIVLQGFKIPKGTDVLLQHGLASINEKEFPQAKEFIPERWLKDTKPDEIGCPHAKSAHPFSYMPFGFGNRACIGMRIAELETAIITCRMVREFEMSWHYPPPKIQATIVQSIAGDFKLRLVDLKH